MTLKIDERRHEVFLNKKEVELTPKEYALLKYFRGSEGVVVTRQEILANVWGSREGINLDTRTVDQHIARLRKKFGAFGRNIKTVTSFGYKFCA